MARRAAALLTRSPAVHYLTLTLALTLSLALTLTLTLTLTLSLTLTLTQTLTRSPAVHDLPVRPVGVADAAQPEVV